MIPSELTKNYYSIGEVAKMFDLNTSALRFWEKEFSELKPKKNSRGIRKYTPKNIEIIGKIHYLVKERGFTIKGAKEKYKTNPTESFDTDQLIHRLQKIKQSMESLKKQLDITK